MVAHGTVHTVYICTRMACVTRLRERTRDLLSRILRITVLPGRKREREGLAGRVHVCVTHVKRASVHTHVYVIARACKKEKETIARYLCARTRRIGEEEPSRFSDTYTRIRYVDDAVINSAPRD